MTTQPTTPKPFVFVLMPFDAAFSDIYRFGIKGAAEDVGAYAERLDEQIFTEGMLDRIFNQISKADVIVADMTGRNANVFYEVGYAHALGKIVLLLTQNATDIPFDLAHRQHIVYDGQIESLRKQLTPKLQWAITEGQKLDHSAQIEQIAITAFNLEIPPASVDGEMPVIDGRVTSQEFTLPLYIRNASIGTLPRITHVYLFTTPDASVIPYNTIATSSSFDYGSDVLADIKPFSLHRTSTTAQVLFPTSISTPLEPMLANEFDGSDGLTHQYRLPMTLPELPPGVVEYYGLNLMLRGDNVKCNVPFRLRIHTVNQFHDFSFRLQLEVDISAEQHPEKAAPSTEIKTKPNLKENNAQPN